MTKEEGKLKPIHIKNSSFLVSAWYIYGCGYEDILEGEGCGPFATEDCCRDAIREIENDKREVRLSS